MRSFSVKKHNFNIRTNTKHIANGDVFFCFPQAETYITIDVLNKASIVYAVEGFCDRVFNKNNDINARYNDYQSKIIEVAQQDFYSLFIENLKERYKVPRYLCAITGTKGKTSTCWFVLQMMNLSGKKCGYIGTIGAYYTSGIGAVNYGTDGIKEIQKEDTLTTPFADEMYYFLDYMFRNNVENVVFEASSHALEQHRISGLHVNVSGFTNLSQDHLDYHQTMEKYLLAKEKLFSEYQHASDIAIINGDDFVAGDVVRTCKSNNLRVKTFGENDGNDCRIVDIQMKDGIQFVKFKHNNKEYFFKTDILGTFQVKNLILALLIAEENGCDIDFLCKNMSKIIAPNGRMQRVSRQYNDIFVDYAHTPKSLEESLLLLNGIYKKVGVVFGCGGDRDAKKRPIMFEIAKHLSDAVFLTSDNPRTENRDAIIEDILCFENDTNNILRQDTYVVKEIDKIKERYSNINRSCNVVVDADRATAIAKSIDWFFSQKHHANSESVCILIAGKGHEDYQIIGNTKIHFDDKEVALKILQEH